MGLDLEAHQQYAELLNQMGRIAESVRSADRAAALDPAPIRIYVLAEMEAYLSGVVTGDFALIPPGMHPYLWASDWMMVGESDRAVANRRKPVIDDESSLPWKQSIWLPVFDSVRADPRIQGLLETSGLAGVQVSALRSPSTPARCFSWAPREGLGHHRVLRRQIFLWAMFTMRRLVPMTSACAILTTLYA